MQPTTNLTATNHSLTATGLAVQTVGVIGAGVMGSGVAQTLAGAGLRVLLLDVSGAALDKALVEIGRNVRFNKLFRKEEGPDSADTLSRITPGTDFSVLEKADFVIENVTENESIKEKVYRQMDPVCPPQCIFAANTSAIPITRIASWMQRPERVLGMHFMNPVPLKMTVEVIRGHHTSQETLDTAKDLLSRVGKECVVVNDSPGFVSNRVLMLTINEAIFLLQENVAATHDIDRIFKSCFGHTMGPLETADLIGLDTILFSLEVLYENFHDGKYRACPLLRKMVDAGLHGRKNGQGFYTYAV
jgi:3-hydroxybutyryl-CoA dehydrogenase